MDYDYFKYSFLFDNAKILSDSCLDISDYYYTTITVQEATGGTLYIRSYCVDSGSGSGKQSILNYKGYYVFSYDTENVAPSLSYYDTSSFLDLSKSSNYRNSKGLFYTNFPLVDLHIPNILSLESKEITIEEGSTNSIPFEREEFIAIPFLLCILILMLFLKWVFPMKGGKSV